MLHVYPSIHIDDLSLHVTKKCSEEPRLTSSFSDNLNEVKKKYVYKIRNKIKKINSFIILYFLFFILLFIF